MNNFFLRMSSLHTLHDNWHSVTFVFDIDDFAYCQPMSLTCWWKSAITNTQTPFQWANEWQMKCSFCSFRVLSQMAINRFTWIVKLTVSFSLKLTWASKMKRQTNKKKLIKQWKMLTHCTEFIRVLFDISFLLCLRFFFRIIMFLA